MGLNLVGHRVMCSSNVIIICQMFEHSDECNAIEQICIGNVANANCDSAYIRYMAAIDQASHLITWHFNL